MQAIAFHRLAKWGDQDRCACGHMPVVDELVLVRKEHLNEKVIECAECRPDPKKKTKR